MAVDPAQPPNKPQWTGPQFAGVVVIVILGVILVWNAYHPEDVFYHDLDYEVLSSERYDPREDVSRAGHSLQIANVAYPRGIAVQAPAELNLRFLPPNYAYFMAEIGLDAKPLDKSQAQQGSVVFQVIGDGTVLYQSPVITPGMQPFQVFVPVLRRRELTLKVDDAGDGNTGDDAIWAMPRFVHSF